jgi:suppressor of ftsI
MLSARCLYRRLILLFGTAVAFAGMSAGGFAAPAAEVGANVATLGSGGGVAFVDAMKEASPWTSSGHLELDALGNVVALAPQQSAETIIYPSGTYVAGAYTLLYDGTGSFALAAESGAIVSRAPGRLVLRITPKRGYGIRLRLLATDPRNYARNIRLILPGLGMSYGRSPFTPSFVASLRGVGSIRFGGWLRPEPAAGRSWGSRTLPQAFTQAGPQGVAVEYAVALANLTGTNPWFTLPVDASDDYVLNFASLVARQLDPRLRPSYELGHEVFRAGTAANAYASLAGVRLRLASDPRTAALAWYSLRSVQVFALVDRAAKAARAVPTHVLSGPFGISGTANGLAANFIISYANAGRHADAFAVSADAGASSEGGSFAFGTLPASFAAAAALADKAHLRFDAYQGGIAGQITPGLLGMWRAAGGGLFVADALDAASPNSASSALLGAAAYSRLAFAAAEAGDSSTRASHQAVGLPASSEVIPGTTLLGETFGGIQTPARAWLTTGGACLTAGSATTPVLSIAACNGFAPHAVPGNGVLQLTSAAGRHALAVYRTPFETSRGLEITFSDASFGRAPPSIGDSLTLSLADAARLMPSSESGDDAPSSAYLSVKLGTLEKSGESSLDVHGSAQAGSPAFGGPIDAAGRPANLPLGLVAPSAARLFAAPAIRMTLTPSGGFTLAIDRHDGNGFIAYERQQIAGRAGQPSLPSSVYLTFGASSTDAGRIALADLRVATLTPATTFSPSQLHSLLGLYDATLTGSLTKTSSGAVTAWQDVSGNADNLSVPATHTPPVYVAGGINGLPSISFDGTTGFGGSNPAVAAKLYNESTVFIVGSESPTTLSGDILYAGAYGRTSPVWAVAPTNFSNTTFAFNTTAGALSTPKVESGPTIWTAGGSVSSATRYLRRNGSVVASGAGPSIVAHGTYPLSVGEMWSGGSTASYGYRGQIGEIVTYQRLLTSSESTEVEGYLACKWGLQGKLPANHPYRSACPGASSPNPTPAPSPSSSAAALPDPVQLRSQNFKLTLNVSAVINPTTHDPALSYNGSDVPPTLRLSPGDTLIVNLTNELPVPPSGSTYANDVNLHYHGLHVSPNAPADDSIDMVAAPGKSVQYKVPIPSDHPPGLYWYHSHAHAESERQNLSGMSGALIIEGIAKYTPAVTNLPERILIVRDAQPAGTALPPGDLTQLEAMRYGMARMGAARANGMSGMSMGMDERDEIRGATTAATRNPYVDVNPFYTSFLRPDAADTHCQGTEAPNKVWTLNGVSQPSIGLKPGQKQFWRLVNAGSDTYLDVALDRANMQIIALDGIPLISGTNAPASMTVSHYVVPPASRIEFIVTGPAAGTTAYLRTNCFDAGPTGLAMPAAVLASIDPSADAPATSRHTQLLPAQARPFRFHTASYIKAHAASVNQTVYFSEQLQINGQSYNPSGPPMFYAQVGTTQDWTIVNTSTQVHTFHMHQIHFIVQSINGVTQAQQFVMDNVNIPAATSSGPGMVQVRLDFTDPLIVGTFLFHCHILSHEDSGMMAKIRVGTAPPLVTSQSSLTFATPSAPRQTFTVAGGKAPYSPTGCSGVANASISGTTVSVAPAGAGDCLLTIEDATGLTASISIAVTAVKSPVTLSTTSASFSSTAAAAQKVGISGGALPYTATGCAGTAAATISGSTLTVSPKAVGTCTLVVSDAKNETASLSVAVNAASTGNTTDSLTFHQDALRTGWYQHETTLSAANVASSDFGRITSLTAPSGSPAFGKVYAQPLYATNEATSDGKKHNLVIVATSTDQIYAFDAATNQVVWHRNFLSPPTVVQQSWTDTSCYSPGPDVGITGTPVIDRTLDRIYAVVATKENGTFHQRIHAISLRSGAEAVNANGQQVGPTDVSGTVTMATGGTASVDPLWNVQRPALLESAGNIYVALGSRCDWHDATVHGWMLAYSASSLQMTGNMLDTSNENDGSGTYLASIWMSGYGPAADAQGNVYFATGNGPNDGGVNAFGMSVVKIAGTLSRAGANVSTFSPYLEKEDSEADADLGSGGVMLLPDQKGAYAHMLVAGGKCGAGTHNGGTAGCQKYVLNRDKLGGRQANEAGALWHGNIAGWMWGGPAYFQDASGTSHVVYGGGSMDSDWAPLATYNLATGPVALALQSAQRTVGCFICSRGNPGGSLPVVSSNGTQANSAIVWAIQTPLQSGGTMTLYAFNALQMSTILFSGAAGSWNVPPGAAQIPGAFVSPLVAGGRVYVPVDGAVGVFGLKSENAAALRATRSVVASVQNARADEAVTTTSQAHVVYGTVLQLQGNVLTVELRNGRQQRVDATPAIAARTYSAPLYVGKTVTLTGDYSGDGTFVATTITKLGRADDSAPPDR